MIISFAWTSQALIALRKHRTRRHWTDNYARRWVSGSTHQAYDRNPRVHGKQVGLIMLSQTPFKQRTSMMTEEDYELEGLKYMEESGLYIPVRTLDGKKLPAMHPRQFFNSWREADEEPWVIDFAFSPFTPLL